MLLSVVFFCVPSNPQLLSNSIGFTDVISQLLNLHILIRELSWSKSHFVSQYHVDFVFKVSQYLSKVVELLFVLLEKKKKKGGGDVFVGCRTRRINMTNSPLHFNSKFRFVVAELQRPHFEVSFVFLLLLLPYNGDTICYKCF